MKRYALLGLLFCLLGTVGCMNKNETNKSEADKKTSVPTKIITEDKPTSGPIKDVTEDKSKENLNANKKDGIQSEAANKTNDNLQDLSSFIPKGWHILQKSDGELAMAEGDLNKDGIIDKAFVIEESIKGEGSSKYALDSPRNLLIVFGNKNNTYTLSIKAEKAILLGGEGGGFGDPFDNIKVDRGSILLKFFGGSGERWYMDYRFRYQNNSWCLIGATEGSLVNIDGEMDNIEEDYNLLTGDYIFRKLVDGKIKITKGNRGKRQLVNLQDFDVHFESKSQF
ncbi:MAG: hypothetical protein N2484_09110 [Clostridia bacterium]|nr:hypothetical protein [Clostridia bacterium]